MKLDRTWKQALDGDRPVDLFTGIALFVKSSEPEKPIDLLKDAPIHPPIPNIWWLENRMDPGFADSPGPRSGCATASPTWRNIEAKTDPNNAKSHPAAHRQAHVCEGREPRLGDPPGLWLGRQVPVHYEDAKGREEQGHGRRDGRSRRSVLRQGTDEEPLQAARLTRSARNSTRRSTSRWTSPSSASRTSGRTRRARFTSSPPAVRGPQERTSCNTTAPPCSRSRRSA